MCITRHGGGRSAYQVRDDAAHAALARHRQMALLQDLVLAVLEASALTTAVPPANNQQPARHEPYSRGSRRTLATCSMVTTTRSPLETRSIAPPMPLTILPCARTHSRAGTLAHLGPSAGSPTQCEMHPVSATAAYRDDPVGQVAVLADFHRPENGEADAPTASARCGPHTPVRAQKRNWAHVSHGERA